MNLSKHWAAVLDDYVIDLAWSPDGAILAAASAAGCVVLLDAATGAVRHALTGHVGGTNCLGWMPRPITEDRGQKTAPTGEKPSSVLGSPSSDLLATGGQDGCVRFWSAATGQQTAEVKLGPAWVEHLAWRPVQRTEGREQRTASSSDHPPTVPGPQSSDFRPPSSVVGSSSSVLCPPSSALSSPSSVLRPPSSVLFANAGKKLVALGADGSVVHTFKDAPKTISALAWRNDGSLCAAACFGSVSVWEAGTFAAHDEFTYGNAVLALVWSPNGRWLVAGCQDNAVHLWAPAEGLELHMSGYEAKLQELSFSPDSKWLATGGGRDACVWDCAGAGPADREPLLLPHKARIGAVAFQHTHNVVATGAADGEFCLWAPTHRNPLVAEVKMPSAATKFAWRADDSLLAAGTEQGTVFVFKL